jgi:hypothetical protein
MFKILDKKESWGIIDYGQVSIDNIILEVLSYHSEWLIDQSRQKTYQTHKDTSFFQLKKMSYNWTINSKGKSYTVNNLKNKKAQEELEHIYSLLEKMFDGKIIRAELITMNPNSRIRTHRDRGDILFLARRIHIPIKTNKDVIFKVNKDLLNMKVSNIYEINNFQYHSVINNSEEERVHLIIDVLPKEFLKNVLFL